MEDSDVNDQGFRLFALFGAPLDLIIRGRGAIKLGGFEPGKSSQGRFQMGQIGRVRLKWDKLEGKTQNANLYYVFVIAFCSLSESLYIDGHPQHFDCSDGEQL